MGGSASKVDDVTA